MRRCAFIALLGVCFGSASAYSQVAVDLKGADVIIPGTISAPSTPSGTTINSPGLDNTTVLSVTNTGGANATLITGNGSSAIFSGAITDGFTNTTALTKIGTGTLTLSGSGTNTYSGPTTISVGTLKLGASSSLSPNSPIINNGTLDISGLSHLIFSLSGSGNVANITNTVPSNTASDVIVIGGTTTLYSGTLTDGIVPLGLILSANSSLILTNSGNTYSFETIINAGSTLQLGNGGTTGAIVGDVTNNGIFAINRSNAYTFGGVISGTGAFQQNGGGTTTLLNTSTYTGATFVNAGTLSVTGDISLSSGVTVNNGGTLGGTGTVSSVIITGGGTLAPGNPSQPLGTFHITGSLAFNAGSFYSVNVTPSTNSATNISGAPGTATIIGGTVVVTPLQLGAYNNTYTILTAAGGRSGMFSGLTVNTGFSGTSSLSYDATHVFLTLAGAELLGPPGGAGLNVNQQNVLNGINNAILSGGTIPAGFLTLAGLSGGALQSALDQLSGEPRASFTTAGLQAGNSFLNLLLSPIVQSPGNGFSSRLISGFTTEEPPALPEAALAIANVARAAPREISLGPSTQRFQLWGSAYGGTASVDGDAAIGSHNTSSHIYGFATGLDYRVAPDAMIGFALAGGGTSWGLNQGLGSGRSDMFQAGIYGTKYSGPAYLAGALGYAWHDVTTNRTVMVAGTDVLSGNFHANWFGARIEGGYRYAMPTVSVTPYVAAQVQTINMPSYAEAATSGSPQFALTYASQTTTTTRTELGASFDKTYALHNGASLLVFLRAAWAHDFNNNNVNATALFQTLPGSSFVVNGGTPAPDSALVTAGAEYKLTNGWSIFGKFVGQFSSNTSLYAGTATIRYAW
jgi:outer membrane autotransporter protein